MLWRLAPFGNLLRERKDDINRLGGLLLDGLEAKIPRVHAIASQSGQPIGHWIALGRVRDGEAWLHLAEIIPDVMTISSKYGNTEEQHESQVFQQIDLIGSCLLLSHAYGCQWAGFMMSHYLAIAGHPDLALRLHGQDFDISLSPLTLIQKFSARDLALRQLVPTYRPQVRRLLREADEKAGTVLRDEAETVVALRPERAAPAPPPDGPYAKVLRRPALPPADRDFKRIVDEANSVLARVPLRETPDPDRMARELEAEFPWMPEAVEAVRASLVLSRRLGGALALQPTVLVGPAGCGKSRFARRAIEIMRLPYTRMSCAGLSDNRVLAGTARGWSSQSVSLPVSLMMRSRIANSALILDELDKAGGSSRSGRVDLTLLSMIEPETAANYLDEALCTEVDLSRLVWLFTANDRSRIAPLLRSRLDFVEVGPPRPEDFESILEGALRDIAAKYRSEAGHLPDLDAVVVSSMRSGFRDGSLSARQLTKLVMRAVVAAADAEDRMPRN